MPNIRFVVFHTGVESLQTYLPLMEVGKEALAFTNPGARYVVLTDKETAPRLENRFEVEVLAPSGWPLMRQYVEAQRLYEANAAPGLVVLAATDCVASRDLSTALSHNMAVTYRDSGRHIVNNIAYIEDHDRAAWFLQRALDVMRPESYDFWGDQESWEAALGPTSDWEHIENDIRLASPEGRWIHLYPCATHNYFPKRNGAVALWAKNSYLWHFKGPRKINMVASVKWNLLREGQRPRWQELKALMADKRVTLPMEVRRTKCKSP